MKESTTQKTTAPTTRSQAPVPSERPKIPLMDTAVSTGPRRSRINSRENRTLLDILDYKMKTKVQEIDRNFRQRFPRDNRKSSHRRRVTNKHHTLKIILLQKRNKISFFMPGTTCLEGKTRPLKKRMTT